MKVCNLRFESMRDPVGIDITEPMLSWMVTSENRCSRQSAWQLQIFAETAADQLSLLHDTGIVSGDDNSMLLRGVPLLGYTVYHWKVRVWDEDGRPSDWSSAASFETGILCNSDWDDTHWVEPEQKDAPRITQDNVSFEMFPELHDEERFVPTLLLKQCFQSSNNVWKARAYVSAHGVYQFRLNGKRIGNYELSPEVTPYDKYLQYQTYDITDALRTGENTAAVHLAPGWWSGVIGLKSSSCQYGSKMAAIFRIVLFLRDGSRRIFCSGEDTMAEQGPYRYAELYMGEYFDSNLALRSGSPLRVSFPAYDKRCLRGQNAPHIHVVKTIACKRQLLSPKGEKILDFGEILAGKARLVLRARKHTAVRLHYFQQLDADGNYFLGVTNDYNQMTDTYVFHSDADECYEPIFVYRGFRYIWIEGDAEVCLEQTKALLMSTTDTPIGSFVCSDDRITRLAKNVQRTATANYMAIPTDNPDRERAGWTGDGQMFFEAGSYCVEARAFWRRWLEEMRLEQEENGNIPLIVPNWKSYQDMHAGSYPNSSAWGDACVLIPWMYYQKYGDIRILKENYGMMRRWMQLVQQAAEDAELDAPDWLPHARQADRKYLQTGGFHFGDWLTPSDCTDENGNFQYVPNTLPLHTFTPQCYYSYTTELMSKISTLVGEEAESRRYAALSEKIRAAAFRALFREDGTAYEDRQGALVLGVQFGLLPEPLRKPAMERLLQKIEENGGRMDTGFTSTQYLLDTLTEQGYVREAYDRLLCNVPPSWLYEVEQGATAIWESWQGIMPDGQVNPVSFIQYAAGTVGAWLYKTVAGISEEAPGYKKIRISPQPDARLHDVRASYATPHGRVESAWRLDADTFTLNVVIPANTQASIHLPGARIEDITEGGIPAAEHLDFYSVTQLDNSVLIKCGSGSYRFSYKLRETHFHQ